MKIKATVIAFFLLIAGSNKSNAAILYVDTAPAGLADCSSLANACLFPVALAAALQGDTILLDPGTYAAFPATDLTLDYLTITCPLALTGVKPTTGARTAALEPHVYLW